MAANLLAALNQLNLVAEFLEQSGSMQAGQSGADNNDVVTVTALCVEWC
jgi:hypothetical protein